MPATRAGSRSARQAATAARTLSAIASADCSTQPGCGCVWLSGAEPCATIAPAASTSTALVELVPWSIASRSGCSAGIEDLADGGGDAVGGQPEVVEQELGAAGGREALDPEDAHRHRPLLRDQAGHRGAQATGHRGLFRGHDPGGV